MVSLHLTRWWTDDYEATVGRLVYPGGWCFTLEPPWRQNAEGRSCIPLGWYEVVRDTFKGQYENFRFIEVVGRDGVELHIGNRPEETRGCLLLGSAVTFDPTPRLIGSTAAFTAFMEAMQGHAEAVLAIEDGLQRPTFVPVRGERDDV